VSGVWQARTCRGQHGGQVHLRAQSALARVTRAVAASSAFFAAAYIRDIGQFHQ
jgi:hypothetical protein